MGFSLNSVLNITARKCDVSTLLHYLVGAATFEWKSLRAASDVATEKGLKFVDYYAFYTFRRTELPDYQTNFQVDCRPIKPYCEAQNESEKRAASS